MSIDNKPSKNEDEYFAKRDAELLKAQRAKLDAERKSSARTTHYMKCPKCGADLVEQEHNHVRIDRCPECKGMWLDAGELEMIGDQEKSAVGGFISDMLKGLHFK